MPNPGITRQPVSPRPTSRKHRRTTRPALGKHRAANRTCRLARRIPHNRTLTPRLHSMRGARAPWPSASLEERANAVPRQPLNVLCQTLRHAPAMLNASRVGQRSTNHNCVGDEMDMKRRRNVAGVANSLLRQQRCRNVYGQPHALNKCQQGDETMRRILLHVAAVRMRKVHLIANPRATLLCVAHGWTSPTETPIILHTLVHLYRTNQMPHISQCNTCFLVDLVKILLYSKIIRCRCTIKQRCRPRL